MSRLASGHEVLCRGIFPGESATVRVEAVSRQKPRLFAALHTLQAPHPARRSLACPNHEASGGACGGCALMALDEAAQRELKRELLKERFGLSVSEVEAASAALGYRCSSKRVALRVAGKLVLGSFARGTHDPAPMPGCLVDHAAITRAFADVERAAQSAAIEAYDERDDSGDLRAVWAKTDGRRVIVTLVVRHAESRASALLPDALPELDGVLVSVHDKLGNQLRGAPAVLRKGESEVAIRLLDHAVEVGALGFLQPNPSAAEAAYRALLAPGPHSLGTERAFDLYAGAGVTTQALRARYGEVLACDAHPESAARLGVQPLSAEEFLEQVLAGDTPPSVDLVIANPPRKGLGPKVVEQLRRLDVRELRIMSCGPEGLARDLAALGTGEGAFELLALRAFDTLPQTPHIELVAHLAKAESQRR